MSRRATYRIFIYVLLSLGSRLSYAQVNIPDPNFRQFLLDTFPSVMNPNQTLNVTAAQSLNVAFKCYHKNISNLSGIEYFTSLKTLEVKYNPNLKSIPNIDGLTNITIIGLDSNGLTSLPNLSTLVNLDILSFHHNRITSMPSLSGLNQLRVLIADHNLLTTLPNLTGLTNLEKIICSDNPITSLPSFSSLTKLSLFLCQRTSLSSLPDLNNCTLLEYFICTDNMVTELPNLSNCTLLKELKVFRCKLTDLPNLSVFPLLYVVNAHQNELSFDDISPLTGLSFFGTSTFSNQKPGTERTINSIKLSTTEIQLDFDNSIANGVYTWYKDGVFLSTTSENKLVFNTTNVDHEGVYTCTITNTTPSLTGITLRSKAITLRVSPCIVSNNIEYNILNQDCSYPITIVLNENSFTAGTRPFSYVIKNKQEHKEFNSPYFILNNEGTYDLWVSDAVGCEVNFEAKLVIKRQEKCDPVFYPNGDGVADTYYIENAGKAKIYDRNGILIKELDSPANWDGTNSRGENATSGLYLIIVNESNSSKVTLIR